MGGSPGPKGVRALVDCRNFGRSHRVGAL